MRQHQLLAYYAIAALCVTLRITFCAAGSDDPIKRDHQEEEQQLIPLTKCCDIGQFYNAGFDRCLEWESYLAEVHLLATSFQDVPPFYNDNDGRVVHPVAPSAFLLSLANFTFCPTGQIARSSPDFQLFKNGSMKTVEGKALKFGEFCVDRIINREGANTNLTAGLFVARFCIPDPCVVNNRTGCVRKCCPNGMALNGDERICQVNSAPFEIPFHDESGAALNASHFGTSSSPIVSDGVFVDCQNGAYSLRPSVESDDEFYILPNGRIHTPALGEYHDDYCIDNFIVSEDGVVRTCFKMICY
jgi:hypothetical protein